MHLEDDQFKKEVTNMIGLRHQNIVQLVGYCAESHYVPVPDPNQKVGDRYVMAEVRNRLLCFECINNKSLDKHLSAESCGLEWHVRHEIIKGICRGLHYLHTDCNMVHMDLKPGNILLDDRMVPKISDFGMSRLFGQQQSRIVTQNRGGTLGYMAPEYQKNGEISAKADIFSLGVIIIELMTGSRDYPWGSEADSRHFVETVTGNWRRQLEKAERLHTPLDAVIQQVNECISIGLRCLDPDPKTRPVVWDVIQMLDAVESTEACSGTSRAPPIRAPPPPPATTTAVTPLKAATTTLLPVLGVLETGGESVVNLDKFFEEVEAVKEDTCGLEGMDKRLQSTNEETKTAHDARTVKSLRARMDKDVEQVLRRAKAVKGKVGELGQHIWAKLRMK